MRALMSNARRAQSIITPKKIAEAVKLALDENRMHPTEEQHRSRLTDGLAAVSRRKPRRWHRIIGIGPSHAWHTRCGEKIDFNTMHLERWDECTEQNVKCKNCEKWSSTASV